ncbi:O-fucosyltransferase family protein [Bacillus sp. AFS017336]|uniref:O-fucosyltransferase family protein n=1 Tax=Bacillus sp. AFS017336 TaxID=2033489 RepID=UPI000BEF705E|nr:O-fucosyltransferase family protein [Bacillus sp. AFS017336]PEL09355.1 hypothetical protein CN601_16135 [Bacillus sp. AFS017336]
MAFFRVIGESLYFSKQGNKVGIIINDFQTRNSSDIIDFDINFSKISFDAFVDLKELTQLLSKENILVNLPENIDSTKQDIVFCSRFLNRIMTSEENKENGAFIANHFPFAKKVLTISNAIIDSMSSYSNWKAIHLRIEDELVNFHSDSTTDFEGYIENQLLQAIDMINTPDLSAVYIAAGIKEEKFNKIAQIFNDKLPNLFILNKLEVLKNQPSLLKQLNDLSLEEQALVDWLVCIGAPHFSGLHASSFAYLAGYIRHYRGFDKVTTQLWPTYQPLWELWFPRI